LHQGDGLEKQGGKSIMVFSITIDPGQIAFSRRNFLPLVHGRAMDMKEFAACVYGIEITLPS
jgi:hypothetical protein